MLRSVSTEPPGRRFDAPGASPFRVLKSGESPSLDADSNFVIGPDYVSAPENQLAAGVPEGKVQQFTIDSRDTKIYNPGIAREIFGTVDPNNPKTLVVETHEIDYERAITVYIPAQHQPGSESPFMVVHDGPKGKPNMTLPHILDNLIVQKRIPPIILSKSPIVEGMPRDTNERRNMTTCLGCWLNTSRPKCFHASKTSIN